jgi:hypothetical protein
MLGEEIKKWEKEGPSMLAYFGESMCFEGKRF